MSTVSDEVERRCSDGELRAALGQMTLSSSGWRKVFSPDGEHGRGRMPLPADCCLAAAMGICWGRWLAAGGGRPRVLVASDTRPTSAAISNFLMRGLRAVQCRVLFVGVAAAPEVMAFCRNTGSIAGTAYISASHNPPGYNGVKFSEDGSVIGGSSSASLIAEFRKLVMGEGAAEYLTGLASRTCSGIRFSRRQKRRCLKAYLRQLKFIAGGAAGRTDRRRVLRSLRQTLSEKPLGVVADLNGSARCLSADRVYFESLGTKLYTFNSIPGEIEHEILPEGLALEPCRKYLENFHGRNAQLGYVPDNDGDRGNLVVWDDSSESVRILEAQEVFALAVLAEFACTAWMGIPASTALVVNGPTSHRVRPIAEAYGASVFETEVGEANVVNLARKLRGRGHRVRMLGEGSNGGVIIHPAQVRDPLNTVTALLKLLRLPKISGRPNPFEDWCRRSNQLSLYKEGYGVAEILASLPSFTTVQTSAENSKMEVVCTEHDVLKTEWEGIFHRQWDIHAEALRSTYEFHSWIQLNNSGMNSFPGTGSDARKASANGGLKIVFRDRMQRDAGFLWMRGSGTEPVFRLMAEIRGARPEAEAALIAWHRAMISEADRLAAGGRLKRTHIPNPIAALELGRIHPNRLPEASKSARRNHPGPP